MNDRLADAFRAIEVVDFTAWSVAPAVATLAVTTFWAGILAFAVAAPFLFVTQLRERSGGSFIRRHDLTILASIVGVFLFAVSNAFDDVVSDRIALARSTFEDRGHCQVAFADLWLGKVTEIPEGFRDRMTDACGEHRTSVAFASQ